MQKVLKGFGLVMFLGLILGISTPSAWADNVDFSCINATACAGGVSTSSGTFSSSGITLFNGTSQYSSSVPFTLTFNTSTGNIQISGTGIYAGQNLMGTILSYLSLTGSTSTNLAVTAIWTSLPWTVTFGPLGLGTPVGIDTASVIFITNTGVANSVDVLITPTPEPGTLALFGSGLVMVGMALKKKFRRPAPTSV